MYEAGNIEFAEELEEKCKEIIEIVKKYDSNPNNILSIAISRDYYSYFTIGENGKYIVRGTEILEDK